MSGFEDSRYKVFVPDRGGDDSDPNLGVLLSERAHPTSEEYLRNSTQLLVNFAESEAYFPSDSSRINVDDAKEYLRKVCNDHGVEVPDFYLEVDREEEDPPGVSWEGTYDELFADVWRIFVPGGEKAPLEKHAKILEPEEDEEIKLGLGSYQGATEVRRN